MVPVTSSLGIIPVWWQTQRFNCQPCGPREVSHEVHPLPLPAVEKPARKEPAGTPESPRLWGLCVPIKVTGPCGPHNGRVKKRVSTCQKPTPRFCPWGWQQSPQPQPQKAGNAYQSLAPMGWLQGHTAMFPPLVSTWKILTFSQQYLLTVFFGQMKHCVFLNFPGRLFIKIIQAEQSNCLFFTLRFNFPFYNSLKKILESHVCLP